MKPRLIIPHDPFKPIALVHEASHAVAAYHLRFPYSHVEIRTTGFGRCYGGSLFPDTYIAEVALQIAKVNGEATENQFSVSLGAVFKIARRANAVINAGAPGATEEKLDHYASGDREDLAVWLGRYGEERRNLLMGLIDAEVERIILLPTFRPAVEDVVASLRDHKSLTHEQVRDIIEAGAGEVLRNPAPAPAHGDIQTLASRLSKHPEAKGQEQVNWLAAERALQFFMALRHAVPQ